jgi:DNA primase
MKAIVSMEMALAHYGVRLRRVNKTSLRGACPLPTHPKGGNENSFGVETAKNAWSCQSRGCVVSRLGRKGGNVLDFVAIMEDCSIRDAALKLQEWFGVSDAESPISDASESGASNELVARREEEETESQDEPVNPSLDFQLQRIDFSHPYLRQRGIGQEVAEYFGVGFFPGKGSMQGRVMIPIHNESGQLVAYAGRALGDEEPKYKLPAGFRKSHVLYNPHRAIEAEGKEVIAVEGFFDALKVHQAGFPRVVSLMGATLSSRQETLLIERFERVILMLDGDSAGREATTAISSRLAERVFVRIVRLPDGEQPDRLSSEAIRRLIGFMSA